MRAAFYTLGCKVNQYETAVLQESFAAAGYDIVEPEEYADVYIVNSCTVTAEGDRKSRQAVRRFRRLHPAAVCLTGCSPQAFPELAAELTEADVVTGSKSRAGLLAAVERFLREGQRIVDIPLHEETEVFESMRMDRSSRTRAFVKIEDGCDRRCSYCIIPAARGPVRSKPLGDLRTELSGLAQSGYREVVLSGINLTSYGRDLGLSFVDAPAAASAVPGLRRIRLGSLEPDLLTRDDILVMRSLPRLCPQFHLSLQSGSEGTLRRMGRRYTAAEYRALVRALEDAFPGCSLTTDLMVGFPGETEDEFQESLRFAQEIGFAKAHVFAYSRRPGTVAAELPDQISRAVKTRRAKEMADAMEQCRRDFLARQVGTAASVLFERRLPDGRWEGYTENYTPVLLESAADLAGQILDVRIVAADGDGCVGEL